MARRKLRTLNNAQTLDDLRIPPANRLEALRGDRRGQHSIRVNQQMSKKLENVHPREVLQEEFLEPLSITVYRLAKDVGVPATRLSEICHGRRSITADTALRLARYFGTSAEFWLGLQEDYDLEHAQHAKAKELVAIKPLRRTG